MSLRFNHIFLRLSIQVSMNPALAFSACTHSHRWLGELGPLALGDTGRSTMAALYPRAILDQCKK